MWRKKYFYTALRFRDVWGKKLEIGAREQVKGSLTVEAAIVVPIVLLCIFLIVQAGIELYDRTAELVQEQEMWEEFHPAQKFRKQELLQEIFGAADVIGGDEVGSNI